VTVEIYRMIGGRYQWTVFDDTGSWHSNIEDIQQIGKESLPVWFKEADFHDFTREQIDMFAAVLRLHGIEVIER